MTKPTFFACPAPKLIVVVVPPEGIHLCGAFSFQPLYGHFEVNGCVFEPAAYSPSSLVAICTPQLTHLPIHFTVLADIFQRQRLLYRLKEVSDQHAKIADLIESKKDHGVLLIKCEADVGTKFIEQQVQEFSVKALDKFTSFNIGPSCYLVQDVKRAGVLGAGPPPSLFERKFKSVLDVLIGELGQTSNKRRVVVVTGNKGVGKSTVVRYMLNRLNQKHPGLVYLLDTDIGQAELTPPGLVSLHHVKKPLLSASFVNAESTFFHSYFFGAISAQVNIPAYNHLVEQAAAAFRRESNANAILVVNTMGEGQDIMYEVIKSTGADCVLNLLSHDPNIVNLQVPPNMVNVINVQTCPRENDLTVKQVTAAQLRGYLFGGYFAQCLRNVTVAPSLHISLADVSPYCVRFSSVSIFIHPELTPVDDRLVLCALNCSVVALCSVDPSASELVDNSVHYMNNASLPTKLRLKTNRDESLPLIKCYGYGFIRAIDKDRRIFYVVTPVAPEKLSSVTVFAMGHELQAHSVLLNTDNLEEAPYVIRLNKASPAGRRGNGPAQATSNFTRFYTPLKVSTGRKRAEAAAAAAGAVPDKRLRPRHGNS